MLRVACYVGPDGLPFTQHATRNTKDYTMTKTQLHSLTIHEALDGLRAGEFTSVELTQAVLDRIVDQDGEVSGPI